MLYHSSDRLFHWHARSKFTIKWPLKNPSPQACVATLPRKILMLEAGVDSRGWNTISLSV